MIPALPTSGVTTHSSQCEQWSKPATRDNSPSTFRDFLFLFPPLPPSFKVKEQRPLGCKCYKNNIVPICINSIINKTKQKKMNSLFSHITPSFLTLKPVTSHCNTCLKTPVMQVLLCTVALQKTIFFSRQAGTLLANILHSMS